MKNDISKLYAIRNNYAKALKKALNKQPRGIPMYLDLHKEKYFNLLTGCFGGKNNLKKQFPNLNNILQLSKNEAPQYNETFIGYCDGAIISFFDFDHGKLHAFGNVNLTCKAYKLFVSLYIMNGDTIVEQENKVFVNTSTVSVLCVSSKDIVLKTGDHYTAFLHVTWQETPDSTLLKSMVTQSNSIDCSVDLNYSADAVKQITLYDPTQKPHEPYNNQDGNEPTEGEIIVAYNRTEAQCHEGQIDYTYIDERDKNGLQKVSLDIKFDVSFNEGYTFNGLFDYSAVLRCAGFGDIIYRNIKPQFVVSNDGTVTITYNPTWDNTIPQSVMAGNRQHILNTNVTLNVKSQNGNQKVNVVLGDASIDVQSNNKINVLPIHLFWGCLAEDTMILMSDGSQKQIHDIVIGDKIRNASGKSVAVTRVIEGEKEIIYHISTFSGASVMATLLHPFAGENRDLLVRDFAYDTKLKIQRDNTFVMDGIANCFPTKYDGKVYSLELEECDDKTIIANGFVTYDNSVVPQFGDGEQPDYLLPDVENAELDKIREFFKDMKSL